MTSRQRHISRVTLVIVLVSIAFCAVPRERTSVPQAPVYNSQEMAQGISIAIQRVKEHGQSGFSVNDVRKTRAWFSDELYDLFIQDMTLDGGIGYLNWDPFTAAQDDVGPLAFTSARQSGDTVLVNFARSGYGGAVDTVTVAMRRLRGTWRIANFIYPAHEACYRDLAAGMAAFAKKLATHHPDDRGSCTN